MNRIDYCLPGTSSVISKELILIEEDEPVTQGDLFVLSGFRTENRYYYKTAELNFTSVIECDSDPELEIADTDIFGYESNLSNALKDIESGKLQKVVVSRQLRLTGKLNTGALFLDLVEKHPNAFVYHLQLNGKGYIGATPEVLIRKKHDDVYVDALAGTLNTEALKNGSTWSDKEYREHALVTEFISNVFIKNNILHEVSERKTKHAGSVAHLYQQVKGTLNTGMSFQSLINDLHPTPAVCGIPVNVAKRWIEEYEPNRGYYTGYLGFIGKNDAQLYVNLRCLEYNSENTVLYVGGGIVEGSNFESELLETKHKAETLLSSIRKFHTIKA